MTRKNPVPSNAPAMHARLAKMGVVRTVRTILLAPRGTRGVHRLVCWLQREGDDLYVKAAYIHHRSDAVTGLPSGQHLDFARFIVSYRLPFGLPGVQQPLPVKTVDDLRAMALEFNV